MMLRLSSAALCLALTAAPLAAQEPAWPAEFTPLIEEAKGLCDGELNVFPETAVQRDLNGDGELDWVLDYSAITCSTTNGLFCGTGGCTVATLIDGVEGALLLHSWDTETEGTTTYLTAPNDAGETVRFLWSGKDWVLQ